MAVLRVVVAVALLATAVSGCLGNDLDEATESLGDSVPDFLDGLDRVNETVADPGPRWPHFPSDGASEKMFLELESFDGHMIPLTVYRPLVASNESQVPVLLHSHGFTGSRASADDAFLDHVAAGFAVVSFDERGHGDTRDYSEVRFMHPDYEVQDVIRIIDEVATWDWVLMDSPGDPRIGAIGGSYGGAFQLMTAIFDDRLDVLVPEITWHDITEALAPGGAINSGWVNLFYLAGNAQQSVTFRDDFHVGWAWALATNTMPQGQAPMVPDLYTEFKKASPASYPGTIALPTLLIQGMPDTLFPLNHAVHNYEMINATGAPVALYTHLGGHVLHTESLAQGQVPGGGVGLQGSPGGMPCGSLTDLQIQWHLRHLLEQDDVDVGPSVCIALEDETVVTGDAWPLPGTAWHTADVGTLALAQAPAGVFVPTEVFTATEETIIAGIPILRGSVTSPGADSISYWSLQILRTDGLMEQYVNDQVKPIRLDGPNTGAIDFELELGGVGTRLAAGDSLYLVASNWEPMYFSNANRLPGAVVFDDLVLELPVIQP